MHDSLSKILIFTICTLSYAHAEPLKGTSLLSSSFQPCSVHCEKDGIKCNSQNPQEHGSVTWCQKNCLSGTKTDLQKYQEGIQSCSAQAIEPEKTNPTSFEPVPITGTSSTVK